MGGDDEFIDWSKSVPHSILGRGKNVILVESNVTCPPNMIFLMYRARIPDSDIKVRFEYEGDDDASSLD